MNSLDTELNPICHLLALLEAHHILHVSRIRVKHKLRYWENNFIFCVSHGEDFSAPNDHLTITAPKSQLIRSAAD